VDTICELAEILLWNTEKGPAEDFLEQHASQYLRLTDIYVRRWRRLARDGLWSAIVKPVVTTSPAEGYRERKSSAPTSGTANALLVVETSRWHVSHHNGK
jgi:hypothetical protein